MPKPPKPVRTQTRFDPTHSHPPETIELVDPTWLLKALALTLGLGLLCALATIAYFHHNQKMHNNPQPPTLTTNH